MGKKSRRNKYRTKQWRARGLTSTHEIIAEPDYSKEDDAATSTSSGNAVRTASSSNRGGMSNRSAGGSGRIDNTSGLDSSPVVSATAPAQAIATTKAITVDLDSTLCDTSARHHLIKDDGTTDWAAYSLACSTDRPVEGVIAVMKAYKKLGYHIIIVSMRSGQSLGLTTAWLKANGIEFDGLVLNSDDGQLHHGEYKVEKLRRLIDRGFDIDLHLDDWLEAADYIEEKLHIPVLRVNPGYEAQPAIGLK